MSIPLVQNNEKDSINTSIIAIKRNIERINMLLGLSNSEEIDTSEFVKKSDIVDEVTVGNMQSVTSNAVAEAINGATWQNMPYNSGFSFLEYFKYSIRGNLMIIDIGGLKHSAGYNIALTSMNIKNKNRATCILGVDRSQRSADNTIAYTNRVNGQDNLTIYVHIPTTLADIPLYGTMIVIL